MRSDPFRPKGVRPLLVLAVLLAGCARAHVISRPLERLGVLTPGASAPAWAAPPLGSVPMGERLEYSISWWGIPVATAVLTIGPAEDPQKRGLILLTCSARSNAYLDSFYPARVELTSLIDPVTRSPRRFQAYVKRRWREHRSIVTFDPVQGTAFHHLPKKKSVTVPIRLIRAVKFGGSLRTTLYGEAIRSNNGEILRCRSE